MEAKIINYIKEKQKEYKYGSDAYNVLRHLEVTLPQFLTQPNNTEDECICEEIAKGKKISGWCDKHHTDWT